MSEPTTRFSIVPVTVTLDTQISHAAFRVLALLSSYADRDGWAWPKQTTLAELLGLSAATVNEHLHKILDLGYIEIHQEPEDGGGARVRTMYRLLYDRGTVSAGPAAPFRPDLNGDSAGPKVAGKPLTNKPPEQTKVTNPTKVGRIHDLLREAGVQYAISSRDTGEIKRCSATADEIAQAYVDLVKPGGGWGPTRLRESPALHAVIWHINAWFQSKWNPNRQEEYTRGQEIYNP